MDPNMRTQELIRLRGHRYPLFTLQITYNTLKTNFLTDEVI